MAAVLSITFPIYCAIAIGYAAVRTGMFRREDMRVLGQYVMTVALPALLFHAVASRDFSEVLQPGYLGVYLAGGLATIATTFAWFTLTAPDKRRRALAVMGCSCPNSGFVGYPLLLLVLPDLAGVALALNFLVENVVLIPICLILMDLAEDRQGRSVGQTIGRIFLDLIRRPMIIGLAAGLAVSLAGIAMPEPVSRLLGMLAASASALALVVIGGSLAGLPLHGNRAMAAQIAVGKLVWHPLMTALAVVALAAFGIVLSPELRMAAILSAAIPIFGVYTVFAQERGLEGAASIAMLAATGGAFITLSALLVLL